jgi:hypothetical protein
MCVAHLASVRKNKLIKLTFAPDLWEWVQKKTDQGGVRVPFSRVVARLLEQVIEKEKKADSLSPTIK